MKKQIKDLELYQIDFLVAKVEGLESIINENRCLIKDLISFYGYSPTTNPSQAWPIIECERIKISPQYNDDWYANIGLLVTGYGKTSLEAAMRAYVASKFGYEVDMDNLINK
ncbi:MAG: DUF2591 family protein [Bacteroidales bacterium]|nr:DUF2591 family protein [Bacteroidales bacterium]